MIFGDLVRRACGATLVLALAACSDGVSVPTTTTPSVTPTTSATPSSSVSTTSPSPTPQRTLTAPVLPDAATKPTRDGAAAFFKYFWAVYDYSFDSLSTAQLAEISDAKCGYCASTVAAISEAKRETLSYFGGYITVRVVVAAPGNPREGLLVNSLIDQAAGTKVGKNGIVQETFPSKPKQRVDAVVRWDGTLWHAMGIVIRKPGET